MQRGIVLFGLSCADEGYCLSCADEGICCLCLHMCVPGVELRVCVPGVELHTYVANPFCVRGSSNCQLCITVLNGLTSIIYPHVEISPSL